MLPRAAVPCAALHSRCPRPGRGALLRRLLLLALVLGGPVGADPLESCRQLRHQRDELAQQAMEEELVLVRRWRERFCPELTRAAEGANAETGRFTPIDYTALLRCRRLAEQGLERSHAVLYRNRLSFPFYTAPGARLAGQADALQGRIVREGCEPPAATGGEGNGSEPGSGLGQMGLQEGPHR